MMKYSELLIPTLLILATLAAGLDHAAHIKMGVCAVCKPLAGCCCVRLDFLGVNPNPRPNYLCGLR